MPRTTSIFWLNSEKDHRRSAICRSVVELCMLRGIPVASFIFSQEGPTRSQCDALATTLAYQVTLRSPKFFPKRRGGSPRPSNPILSYSPNHWKHNSTSLLQSQSAACMHLTRSGSLCLSLMRYMSARGQTTSGKN